MITLAMANAIVEGAFKKGKDMGWKPLACIVLDAGGIPIAYQKQDNNPIMRFPLVFGKAFGSLGIGRASRTFVKMGVEKPAMLQSMMHLYDGKLMAAPGGVIVRKENGSSIIGAVGVSGDVADNDELAAAAGIEAAGLFADLTI